MTQKELEAAGYKIENARITDVDLSMDTVGVSKMSQLKNKYVRVVVEGWGSSIKIIGNIIEDKWFDQEEFFKSDKK